MSEDERAARAQQKHAELREAVESLTEQYFALANSTYNVAVADAYDEVALDLRAVLDADA